MDFKNVFLSRRTLSQDHKLKNFANGLRKKKNVHQILEPSTVAGLVSLYFYLSSL